MRVLFLGLGSIGVRNLEACQRVRPDFDYRAFRSKKNNAISPIPECHSLEELKAFQPELVYVCTPTANHLDSLQLLKNLDCAVFLEKPISHDLGHLGQIEKEMDDRTFFYGCVLRFHPLIQRTYDILKSKDFGRPLTYNLYSGSYLPDWRPGRDYREIYSAKRSAGGGVALDLIHEFDFAEYWFGPTKAMQGYRARASDLEIDSDDVCQAVTQHGQGNREDQVVGSVFLNYFRPKPRRDFKITFESGEVLFGDLMTGSLKSRNLHETHTIDRNALHDRQAEAIFTTIEKKIPSAWNLKQALHLNQLILKLPFFTAR